MSMADWDSHSALAENKVVTEVNVHTASLVWTINNFSYCEGMGIDIESPTFTASNTNQKVQWTLVVTAELERKNAEDVKSDYISSLYLYLGHSGEEKSLYARYSCSIFVKEGERHVFKSSEGLEIFSPEGFYAWGGDDFCEKDAKFRENVLANNVLKIHCEVIFSQINDVFQHHHYRSALFLESTEAKYDSTNIWDILLKTHPLSDVIISAKTKEFPAHKAILAARSKVFAAMFQHDTKENQINRVEIEDMSEESVAEMLHFIYVGKCSENLNELSMELYAVADKYDLDQLKIFCIEALYKNLSVENVVQSLILADTYGITEFKSEVLKFIVANATQVFYTENWETILNNPRLSREVFRAMAPQGE